MLLLTSLSFFHEHRNEPTRVAPLSDSYDDVDEFYHQHILHKNQLNLLLHHNQIAQLVSLLPTSASSFHRDDQIVCVMVSPVLTLSRIYLWVSTEFYEVETTSSSGKGNNLVVLVQNLTSSFVEFYLLSILRSFGNPKEVVEHPWYIENISQHTFLGTSIRE